MSTKEAFERRIEAQLKQMSIEIQRLLDWVDEAEVDLGGEINRAIEEICGRWTDAEREWNRIRTAGEEGWEHLQHRIEAALRDLKLAIEPITAQLERLGSAKVVSVANSP
jgi:hypothetical protein